MRSLAIVGAGVAGLTAARTLRDQHPDLHITLFEQSQTLGGRVTTGRRAGFVFDNGAQYIKAPTLELEQLLREQLPADELFNINQPVWVFDRQGTIAEGDAAQNADPQWCYTTGLDTFGQLLAHELDVRHAVQISRLEQGADQRWALIDAHGHAVAQADHVLLTAPGPQSAAIVAASTMADTTRRVLLEALEPAVYRHCLSLTLAYQRIIPRPFYALVNIDRAHPISWLALEHSKGLQRCPAGSALLIAQMAPAWSVAYWDTAPDILQPMVTQLVGDLLSEDLDEPLWMDYQQWQYALPDGQVNSVDVNGIVPGLWFAGDALAGQGRVHRAVESGWRIASAITDIVRASS